MLIEQKFALRSQQLTIERLEELGMVIFGSAKTVRETLLARQKKMGFGHLIAMLQVATQPAEQTEKSMRLFASEVLPYLRGEKSIAQAAE